MQESALKGFYIQPLQADMKQPSEIHSKLDFHRDDFYIFQLIADGQACMTVDFNDFTLTNSSIFYILPGQIHRRFSPKEQVTGWLLLVEPIIIPPDYSAVFEGNFPLQQLITLSPEQFTQCDHLLSLLVQKYREDAGQPFQVAVMHTILQSFLGIIAGCFMIAKDSSQLSSKPAQIPERFRVLLLKHFSSIKKPSAYAEMMNISESYLNEVLKKYTGFALSYLIRQQIILEAKRLLLYTELSVKEIAYQLGYEEATYFSRIFKNFAKMTPLTFRMINRK